MSFQYVTGEEERRPLNYAAPVSAQPAGGGMGGGMPLGGLSSLMGSGGGATAGTGAGMATSGSAVSGGAAAGGGGAASAGGSMGSAASAAGPWAALAAVILANETYARDRGYRAEHESGDKKGDVDEGQYYQDLLGGDVLPQDVEQRWAPMFGIDKDSKWAKGLAVLSNPATLDPRNNWERIKEIF